MSLLSLKKNKKTTPMIVNLFTFLTSRAKNRERENTQKEERENFSESTGLGVQSLQNKM
jgi:uncharacterized protein (DUF2235 family)